MALVAIVLGARPVEGQTPSATRIRIQASTGSPVSGALVGVIDANGNIVAEGLSNSDGARSLIVPAGNYRVQVRRIGFQPFISEVLSFPQPGDVVIPIVDRAVSLQKVVVTAGARCQSIDRDAQALATVWEEITKALRASQLTTEDLSGIGEAHTYRKNIGPGGKVISNEMKTFKVKGGRPFGAVDPRLLSLSGYVNGNSAEGWEYYAPDETVLLSESFASTHCFRVVRDRKRRGEIGVNFEPVAGRKQAEISGALWVEEKTSELREMRFQFVNVDIISQFDAGGRIHFRRMPSGAWLVDDWSLRFPKLELKGSGQAFVEIGFIENGGGIRQDKLQLQ